MSSIVESEGIAGLLNRITRRLSRKPCLISLYVMRLSSRDLVPVAPPSIELDIGEVTEADERDAQALGEFRFHCQSQLDVQRYLSEGQRCCVAKHNGRVVCCYWYVSRAHHDHYLNRSFDLGENEEYLLGAFTLPEYRGQNVFPHLLMASFRQRTQACPDLNAFGFVRVNNQSSLRALSKLGFRTVGRVGFVEALSIRFHFIVGRAALPQTARRCFIGL